jgi:Uma2 family endonuclease
VIPVMALHGASDMLAHAELPAVGRGDYDMGMPATFDKWTVDLLDALPPCSERFELIDGSLYVTPAPGISHQRAVLRLAALLLAYTSEAGLWETVISPSDVWKDERQENRIQPDIYVVGLDDGKLPPYPFHLSALLLAVEVVSPGNAMLDYDVKRNVYRRGGVGDYWIVDLEKRLVTTVSASGEATVHDSFVEWMPAGATDPFMVHLPSFFDDCST